MTQKNRLRMIDALKKEIRDFFFRQASDLTLHLDERILWEGKPIVELTDIELEGALAASKAMNEAHDKHQLWMAQFEQKCYENRIKRAGFFSILNGTW